MGSGWAGGPLPREGRPVEARLEGQTMGAAAPGEPGPRPPRPSPPAGPRAPGPPPPPSAARPLPAAPNPRRCLPPRQLPGGRLPALAFVYFLQFPLYFRKWWRCLTSTFLICHFPPEKFSPGNPKSRVNRVNRIKTSNFKYTSYFF